jgi:hypothetical protein
MHSQAYEIATPRLSNGADNFKGAVLILMLPPAKLRIYFINAKNRWRA